MIRYIVIFIMVILLVIANNACREWHERYDNILIQYDNMTAENIMLKESLQDILDMQKSGIIEKPKPISRGAMDSSRHILVNMSAYCQCAICCNKTDGITASGVVAHEWNTIAMASNIPFGTKVYIPYFKDKPNGGIFIVEDRGGAIQTNRIDIFVNSHNYALEIGRHNIDAYILQ